MKFVLLLATLLITQTVFARSYVVITPVNPTIRCTNVDAYDFTNVITNFSYDEDESTLVMHFDTYVYNECVNNVPVKLPIKDNMYLAFWKEGLNWPWTPSPFAEVSPARSTPTLLAVELAFDKETGFAKKNQRRIHLQFAPGFSLDNRVKFDWKIDLTKVDENKTLLKFAH